MAARIPKIVVVKEDFGAAQVAEESVGAVVKAANIMNAVDTMATDFMPDEKSVLHNDELGLVFTELTDAEAKSLMGKPGVESVEDDEVVYALQSDEPGLPGDDGSLDEELLDEDLEASAEIDEALSSNRTNRVFPETMAVSMRSYLMRIWRQARRSMKL